MSAYKSRTLIHAPFMLRHVYKGANVKRISPEKKASSCGVYFINSGACPELVSGSPSFT